ncbi:uncharacterized protein At5g39865-like [Tasmannia lanceolata]|uniref:uncharacterized protein At5g39865-like n=1 Tax=Tasmannia lanceolata TaxID=3420 RepID=UPI004063E605
MMGCTASKEDGINNSFPSNPPPPLQLRKSLSLVHHPPLCKGDTHHLVSLTSTTYGSLHLIQNPHPKSPQQDPPTIQTPRTKTHELYSSIIQNPKTKTQETLQEDSSIIQNPKTRTQEYSSIIQNPQPKTQEDFSITHNPQPKTLEKLKDLSIINTWELMAGLEDNSPKHISKVHNPNLHLHDSPKKENHKKDNHPSLTPPTTFLDNSTPSFTESPPKPLWKHLSEVSLLRRSASSNHHQLNSPMNSPKLLRTKTLASRISSLDNKIKLPGCEDRVVLYFTSLRGIRRTYEDCCVVKNIFAGFRVMVDERDISMDAMFRRELQSVLGQKTPSLPQIFIRGKWVGGVEEIKLLHEMGELAKLLHGFPVKEPGVVCESCGDARFVPCAICNGSRKVFEEEERQLRRCLECNENGLLRCPYCCS